MNATPTPETDALHEQRREIHSAYFMMVSNARRLERERNEAREALKTGGLLDIIDRAGHERAAAIRERDEAQNEILGWKNKWDCAIEMGARAECERDEMTLRRNLAISLLDEECALADRLAKGIELFLSQTVSPLAPLKVPLDAWKEARK